MERKGFFDSVAQFVMLVALIVAIICTLGSFVCHFISPESKNLFLQISFCAYGWMVFISVGPSVLRSAFMRIDILINALFPESLRKILSLICEVIMAVLIIAMFYYSIEITKTAFESQERFALALDIGEQFARFGNPGAAQAWYKTAAGIPLYTAFISAAIGYGLGVISYIIRVFKGDK